MIDRMITEDAKKKNRNACFMWIDFQKAYDSISHSWLSKILNIYKIDTVSKNFILNMMPNWKTQMKIRHKEGEMMTEDIKISNGIFQGDSLSPLLFCLAFTPIANIL